MQIAKLAMKTYQKNLRIDAGRVRRSRKDCKMQSCNEKLAMKTCQKQFKAIDVGPGFTPAR